jgi:hypothetical protein
MYNFAYRLPVKRLKLILVEVTRIFVGFTKTFSVFGDLVLFFIVLFSFSVIGNEIIVDNEC